MTQNGATAYLKPACNVSKNVWYHCNVVCCHGIMWPRRLDTEHSNWCPYPSVVAIEQNVCPANFLCYGRGYRPTSQGLEAILIFYLLITCGHSWSKCAKFSPLRISRKAWSLETGSQFHWKASRKGLGSPVGPWKNPCPYPILLLYYFLLDSTGYPKIL